MDKIRYGSKSVTTVVDGASGDTVTVAKHYKKGRPVMNKVTYQIHHKLNRIDVLTLQDIVQNLFTNPSKLDPNVALKRIGRDNNNWVVVETYSRIE